MKKKLTQSQIKERQEKTKKIKSLLIRSLNIVCYCLSVLFIIMAIAIGAQSCSNKNKSETESAAISPSSRIQYRLDSDSVSIDDFKYFYTAINTGDTFTWTRDYQNELANDLGVEISITSSSQPSNSSRSFELVDCYVIYNGNLLPCTRIFYEFSYMRNGSTNVYGVYFYSSYLLVNNSGRYIALFDSNEGYTSCTYTTRVSTQILASSDIIDVAGFSYFYNETEINPTSFTFNNQINYNATYGGDISQPFLAIGSTAESTQTTLDFGWFWSGGKLWDGIKVYWVNAYASSFMMESRELYNVGSNVNIYSYFLMMEYRNSITGEGVVVNKRDSTPYDNNGGLSYYVERSSTWVSSNYQTITLLTDTSEINITNLNKYNNATAGGSITTGGNIGLQNGFTLLGSAFSSILPFLAIQVLPGLSIGLLLFIPLIVIIIVLVFKVVKK